MKFRKRFFKVKPGTQHVIEAFRKRMKELGYGVSVEQACRLMGVLPMEDMNVSYAVKWAEWSVMYQEEGV
ncbi:hypothetical protein WIX39_022670 [Variovorax sp. AB1(2024)]|uniref:hypothetical protein n=1 Tax=Variovorax sp. AB1(2024) TaxID=3132214 RepID=UPI0030B69A19